MKGGWRKADSGAYNTFAKANVYNNLDSIFHKEAAIKNGVLAPPVSFGSGDHINVDLGAALNSRLAALNTIAKALSSTPYTSVTECHEQPGSILCVAFADEADKKQARVAGIGHVLGALDNLSMASRADDKINRFQTMYSAKNEELIATIMQIAGELEQANRGSTASSLRACVNNCRAGSEIPINMSEELMCQVIDRIVEKDLFQAMYRMKNSRLTNIITQMVEEMVEGDTNQLQEITELQHCVAGTGTLTNPQLIHAVTNRMFSPKELRNLEQNIDLLQDKEVVILSEVEQGYIEKCGIHTDLKSIPYMREKHPTAKVFNVGIANANPGESFCCVGCTTEQEVLKDEGVTINVSAISHDHFPKGFYAPSMNVASDTRLLNKYTNKLYRKARDKKENMEREGKQRTGDFEALKNAASSEARDRKRWKIKSEPQQSHIPTPDPDDMPPAMSIPPLDSYNVQSTTDMPPPDPDNLPPAMGPTRWNMLDHQQSNLTRYEKSSMEEGKLYQSSIFQHNLIKLNEVQKGQIQNMILDSVLQAQVDHRKIEVSGASKERHIGKWVEKIGRERDRHPVVTLIPESEHVLDHSENIDNIISSIQDNQLPPKTVICLERKQEGENLGMKDVILLSKILEHNKSALQKDKIALPAGIENTPIYKDAELYSLAQERGIPIIGIEGKGLPGKYLPNGTVEESNAYNKAREAYMVSQISDIVSKGYNVLCPIGKSHERNVKSELVDKGVKVDEMDALRVRTTHTTHQERVAFGVGQDSVRTK
ncbi:hypothetical protein EDM53_02245 [Rickettsiales endosymbiont of Peranema trichophorum]|uniref:hypothetical protein n=1 Tax=Rickettsiales endosymbiont of Peranema trichophorum TaxID=2486577 RepID=UPI00102305CB|nr:hypothetical protein [Rickettsiales endosymbiont of Peranema trichophorum]RZI47371.1 hypothetical protein EDM53_02245 [Rickettsiales endosymbiont of Peranema trichophorum]